MCKGLIVPWVGSQEGYWVILRWNSSYSTTGYRVKYFEYSENVFVLAEFLSPERCLALMELAESIGFEDAPIRSTNGEVFLPGARNNSRAILEDATLTSELWDRFSPHMPEAADNWHPIGLNERIRFYRYDKYQSFSRHSDGRYHRSETEESRFTFMIYLNSGYDGGFTDFGEFKVWPDEGMALCFPHELSHEGAPVTYGRKYVLRSDVMCRYVR